MLREHQCFIHDCHIRKIGTTRLPGTPRSVAILSRFRSRCCRYALLYSVDCISDQVLGVNAVNSLQSSMQTKCPSSAGLLGQLEGLSQYHSFGEGPFTCR